ncbi:hypothetical protein HPB48_020367 [Haemaphysalis longicornis]|uniref:Peptidase M13 C-terminal domain-containing protein n=1 Tax=Haemaphysalis longicornis TaxID=44386 RepID=A0A9J6GZV2_HAELO|nr:hypothetical protein HPB48_020367 [Haemaphysalis longicornis]
MASPPSALLPSSPRHSRRSPSKTKGLIRSPDLSGYSSPKRPRNAQRRGQTASPNSVRTPEDDLPPRSTARRPRKYKTRAKYSDPRPESPTALHRAKPTPVQSSDASKTRPLGGPSSLGSGSSRATLLGPHAGQLEADEWGSIHPAGSVASDHSASFHRRRWTSTRLNCLAATLVSVAAVTLILLAHHLLSVRWKMAGLGKTLCTSGECLYHANLVANHIDRGADPCENFEAFACSRWEYAAGAYGYGTAIMRVQISHWFTEFEDVLAGGAALGAPGVRVRSMYDLCLSDVSHTASQSGVRALKSFMLARNLRWPEPPLPGVEPLGVLLDLAYHWRLGLWFDASRLHTTPVTGNARERSRTLLIEPGAFVGAWKAQHDSVRRSDGYDLYWKELHLAFSEPGETLRDVNISEIKEREAVILHELSTILYSTVRKPVRFPIEDVDRFTPAISKSTWTQEIAKKIVAVERTKLSLTPFESILASDIAILKVLNKLYARYDRQEILDHLSWFFVQVFASLADRRYLVHKYGSQILAEKRRHVFCATEVEASNQFLIAALYARLHSSGVARNRVVVRLEAVKQAALQKILNGTSWVEDFSRELIAAKVRNQQIVLWPPDDLLSDDALSEMYQNLREYRGSFIEYWLDAYNHKRTLLGDPRYEEAMKLARNFVLPYFEYDYVSNAVRVAIGAVDIPLYAAGSTAAVLYGGLGFSYATQLVKAFDEGGLTVDPHGAINDSWSPPSWKRKCSTDHRSPFPEIPALQVAHAAFRRALANDSRAPKRLMEDYTEEQVFFIMTCFTLCQLERSAERFYGGDCNRAVRNFAPFAEAFACPDGSKMNPNSRCPYFD